MRIIQEPKVFLVGVQQACEKELFDYLRFNGSEEWSTAGTGGEALCEVGGRICYDSFTKPRPGGNKAYLERILSSGHGCYDGDTEVLTSDGWREWSKVNKDHRFATRRQDGKVEYHQAIALYSSPYKGKMYRVDSQQVDLLVTPNHNMYVCKTTTVEGRKKHDSWYSKVQAKDLGHVSHAYVKSGNYSGEKSWFGRDFWAMLGFAIGDGYVSPGSQFVQFHLRRERKISWLRSVCSRLGWDVKESGDRYKVSLPLEGYSWFSYIYDGNREKQIPQSLLTSLDSQCQEGLLEGLLQSDGHHSKTGDLFDTTSPTLPGQLQQLCMHLGLAANIEYTYSSEERPTSYGDKSLTRLGIIRKCLKPEVNKWSECKGRTYWVEDWEGDVYCAQVPNGTLYVKRNGKPVWCGNSVLEHAIYSFIFSDISRTCTHELVRHRAGWGYSQRSQRYVEEGDADMVLPEDLKGSYQAIFQGREGTEAGLLEWRKLTDPFYAWESSCKLSLSAYRDLVEQLMNRFGRDISPDMKTELRKRIRQTSRSVLPGCTATTIFCTVNARAARHFLEMRGSKQADPEIRALAVKVWEKLLVQSPLLFGDYKLVDGSLTTDWKKV